VQRLWLTHLVDNVDRLPPGQVVHLSTHSRGRLREPWLERYSALELYQLARNGWMAWLKDERRLLAWENGDGDSLPLGSFRDDLVWRLVDTVLPRVCRLTMLPEARFRVYPPTRHWRSILADWREFVSQPVEWGWFVEYSGSIESFLIYEYPGSVQFNSRYKDELLVFSEEDYEPLFGALCKLADARGRERIARLAPEEERLFRRARENFGSLLIGELHGGWRLDSFHVDGH
jgi:hypothetical protein